MRLIATMICGMGMLLVMSCASSTPKPPVAPEATIRPDWFHEADDLIDSAIAAGKCPGAVLLVGQGEQVVDRKAYGNRSLQPQVVPETADTIFDMASLTKAVATAPSIMILADRGKLDIHDPVAKYLPEFGQNGKQDITIEDLLLHRGGLTPDNDIADYDQGPEQAWKNIFAMSPRWPPRTRFAYSDVGYIVLGKIVEAVSGQSLDEFSQQEIFTPLGMMHTRFKPPDDWKPQCAPTEQRNGHWMIGEVHDPRAYALGGVAGHAGLFSTADDLSRFCRMLLDGGQLDGRRILKESTVAEMIRPHKLPGNGGSRGLGFDIDTAYSSCRGDRFVRGETFGHTGFTGTMFWVDPFHRCYFILLTNSVHPNGKGNVIALRRHVATTVAEALLGKQEQKPIAAGVGPLSSQVLCGIDVLEQENFAALQGKRVALVTNQTGLDALGHRSIDVLFSAKYVHLIKLFSPEHGLLGQADEKVADSMDPATGLRVFSLYGADRKPSSQALEGVDAIVYDIQDVGARFYTYTSTLGLCMEAAAAKKIQMIVLDRPNPLGGIIVDGPLADESHLGFTAYAPIPVAHGMTEGELAKFFDDERQIHCNLTVIPMQGWRRSMGWDETGHLWINPSPNMRNTTQALLYPGIGLLETSNLSVGRGTDQPFEMFGAPWIDGRKLSTALNGSGIAGLRFVPITFTPKSSVFEGKSCEGCYIEVIDRAAVQPVRAGLTIAWELKRLFGDSYHFDAINRLLDNDQTMKALESAAEPQVAFDLWQKPLADFKMLRERYLLYP